MTKYILSFFLLLAVSAQGQDEQGKTALLLIDIQEFYFPGGDLELSKPIKAAENASVLLDHFRDQEMLIVHVQHKVESGGAIYDSVSPQEGEMVISKENVNSFKDTELKEYLDSNNIKHLVICGMQTHMCVEAATRAASDYNYSCTVISDACATRDLLYGDYTVKARDVHHSTLTTLKSYGEVTDTKTYLNKDN